MNWSSKQSYGTIITAFIIFFFTGILLYRPILKASWYWVPIAAMLYFFGYILLPVFRKWGNIDEKLEKPILERIAKIINDSLKADKELQKYFPKDFEFKNRNAYVRLVNDYSFREFSSALVFDRVKASVADYYFYNFMAVGFKVCIIIDIFTFFIYTIFKYLNINILFIDTSLMFLGRPVQEATLLAIFTGIFCWIAAKYFLKIANIHGKRAQNIRFLLIHQQVDKINGLINYLKEDENLRLIARENINIP
ncbi:MAG: hypothetical protein WBF68_07595 [Atribacterota bacterium]